MQMRKLDQTFLLIPISRNVLIKFFSASNSLFTPPTRTRQDRHVRVGGVNKLSYIYNVRYLLLNFWLFDTYQFLLVPRLAFNMLHNKMHARLKSVQKS